MRSNQSRKISSKKKISIVDEEERITVKYIDSKFSSLSADIKALTGAINTLANSFESFRKSIIKDIYIIKNEISDTKDILLNKKNVEINLKKSEDNNICKDYNNNGDNGSNKNSSKIYNLPKEKSREKEKYIEEEPKKEKIKENLGKEKKIGMFDQELIVPDPKDKKSITEDNLSPKIQNMPIEFDNRREKNNKNIDMDRENTDDMEEDEDSMTEITNEEYVKQLIEAIKQMKEGLEKAKVNFLDLMNNVVQKRKISGRFYEYVTIEDFNEQLKSINITLSDLKLSCLCSKYCIPNELRLVDKNKINKDIQKFIKGTLKLEEDEENL